MEQDRRKLMSNRRKMTNKVATYSSFLENKRFVAWRLLREEEAEKYWLAYIKENPEHEEAFHKAIAICERIRINERNFGDTDFLYQRILKSIAMHRKKRQRRKFVLYSLSTAASIALLFIYTLRLFTPHAPAVSNEEIIGKTLPDQHITLVTGGKTIALDQNANIQLSNGQLSYVDNVNTAQSIEMDDAQTNRLIVPNGKRSSIVLADGSEIRINSGSQLTFPSSFHQQTREIYVEGEIYLHVAASDKQPFIVHTPEFTVKVHGTSFNVSAYRDDSELSVVLVSGSVEINTGHHASVKMRPNERAKLKNGDLTTETVDASQYTSWVNGIFMFDGTPTSEMLKKIGRYYNLSFDGATNLPDKKITGKLFLSENIDDVLASISLLTATEYKREENTIKLIRKNREEETSL